ncbi:sulfur carrier protein ThiS [Nitrosomonadales bacterium]|jgi:sulfur carrier protein|nr:sulfur carrier protein ThiS [Nitrosomonadales bacterium]|tara:strand:- start:12266 stop:12469 length:204 start_codon:yes stop_codon:yes gene_type:complete
MKININGSTKEFGGEKITAEELINQLNLNGKRFAIEKNGEIISKNYFRDIYFNDGDKIEIIGAVGGG